MDYLKDSSKGESRQKLHVWCCEHCQAVHFKAGNVSLDFTKTEFSELAHAVMEIYQQEFGGLEFYKIVNRLTSSDETDDILSSQTVA